MDVGVYPTIPLHPRPRLLGLRAVLPFPAVLEEGHLLRRRIRLGVMPFAVELTRNAVEHSTNRD